MNLTGKGAAPAAADGVAGLAGLSNVSQSNLLSWAGTFGQGLTSLTKGARPGTARTRCMSCSPPPPPPPNALSAPVIGNSSHTPSSVTAGCKWEAVSGGECHDTLWEGCKKVQMFVMARTGVKNMLAGEQQAAVTVAVEGLMEAKAMPELESFATFDPRVSDYTACALYVREALNADQLMHGPCRAAPKQASSKWNL